MGIAGLLPMLKKASANCNVRKFSGCTVAIDAYCWLHKGAFGCAAQLGKGEPTTAYISYCVKYINVLLAHNIKPILVLDGRNLPSKADTEKKRRAKREENRINAKEFLRKGMNKEAWECFTRCVDITPAMAREFIKVLRTMKIDYIVAPYEADAQLAYLSRNNIVDIVITEDSDLVLFGCPKIFFKMSITGDGVLFDQSKIPNCLGIKPEQFNFDRFRWMCILSGCDYMPSLPGIGLVRAKKLIEGTSSQDIRQVLNSIPKLLRIDVEVTEEYIQGFQQAELTFLYQLIFDTRKKSLMPLTPYAKEVQPEDLTFAGTYLDMELALGIALGNVDIHTLKRVDNFDPNRPHSGYGHTSIWSPKYAIPTEIKIVTARDIKPKRTDSPTVGMQTNVNANSVFKKAKHLELKGSNANEADDENLVSLYANTNLSDSPDSLAFGSQIELPDEENVSSASSKRKRASLSQSSPEKGGDDANDDDEQPSKRRSTRRNPFLKTENPSSTNSDLHKVITSPYCLVERNKLYQDSNDVKMIVKSQYFRHLDKATAEEPSEVSSSSSMKSGDFIDKAGVLTNEDTENDQDTQVTIYSVGEEEPQDDIDSLKSSQGFTETRSLVITLEEDDGEVNAKPYFHQKPSFLNSSTKKRISPKRKPNRTVGMSKSALRNIKTDSRQQTISSMFALQPKPQI